MKERAHTEANLAAQFLGFKNWEHVNDIDLAKEIKKGLPSDIVKRASGQIKSYADFGEIVPRATLMRCKGSRRLSQAHSERILAVAKVINDLQRIYHGDHERVSLFLKRKHPLLDGHTPIELASSSIAGADAVRNLLARIEAGIAT